MARRRSTTKRKLTLAQQQKRADAAHRRAKATYERYIRSMNKVLEDVRVDHSRALEGLGLVEMAFNDVLDPAQTGIVLRDPTPTEMNDLRKTFVTYLGQLDKKIQTLKGAASRLPKQPKKSRGR